MNLFIRILITMFALAEVSAWTMFTSQLWQFGNSFKGMGDGAVTDNNSGSVLLSDLLIAVIWLLPVSPYLFMIAGSLNLIAGKSLRVAYIYSLVTLSIMTLVMLVSAQRRWELAASGNIVAGGLWISAFRRDTLEKPPKTLD